MAVAGTDTELLVQLEVGERTRLTVKGSYVHCGVRGR
jgi:hypothetical protein